MSEPNVSDLLLLRPTITYAPSTFLERGAVVPFTTPQLAGARVRPAQRDKLELIVGNPSGGRGVYILPCRAVFAICSPTVHDRQLIKRLEELSGITPSAIRQLSLDIAEKGLAGRHAATAAEVSRAAEATLQTVTNFELLLMLMRQVFPESAESESDLVSQAKRAVAAVAPRLRRSPDEVALCLEELATLFAPLGIGSSGAQARIPRGLAAVRELRSGLAERLRGPPPIQSLEAELVLATADLTISCTRSTVEAATGLLAELPELLRRWAADRAPIVAKAIRPEWLLDGWSRIAQVWEQGGRDQESLFAELADLVPATPREVAEWLGKPVESMAGLLRHSRKVLLNEDWRSGLSLHELVARNERLRAAELEPAA